MTFTHSSHLSFPCSTVVSKTSLQPPQCLRAPYTASFGFFLTNKCSQLMYSHVNKVDYAKILAALSENGKVVRGGMSVVQAHDHPSGMLELMTTSPLAKRYLPWCNSLVPSNSNNTHRRLRLPKVPQFRDWLGVSWFQCTFKHIPHSTFRALNSGIGLGFHGSTAPSNTYHTPRLGF